MLISAEIRDLTDDELVTLAERIGEERRAKGLRTIPSETLGPLFETAIVDHLDRHERNHDPVGAILRETVAKAGLRRRVGDRLQP